MILRILAVAAFAQLFAGAVARAAESASPAPMTQDEQAPEELEPPTLESRIPPLAAKAFSTAHRVELSLGAGLSLNDPFFEKFIPELSVGYHFNEQLYLGVRGGYAFDTNAGHVNACTGAPPNNTCGAPTDAQQNQLPGSFTALISGQFAWTPIYGKLNIFGEAVIHFDTSLVLDVGALILQNPATATTGTSSEVAPQLSPGIAERFFFTDHLALAADLRDTLYFAGGGVQSQMIFDVGLTLLL